VTRCKADQGDTAEDPENCREHAEVWLEPGGINPAGTWSGRSRRIAIYDLRDAVPTGKTAYYHDNIPELRQQAACPTCSLRTSPAADTYLTTVNGHPSHDGGSSDA
jgi:hypothetical protein